MRTPWGESQYAEKVTDGIVFYSTATHGGFHLSPERHEVIKTRFPEFKTFSGGSWYEEDCDAALVVVTFMEYFKFSEVRRAVRHIQSMAVSPYEGYRKWKKVAELLNVLDKTEQP